MLNATPLLKGYAAYRSRKLQRLDPIKAQEAQLKSLLHSARDTRFGKEYNFSSIRTVEQFQAEVPLRTYEDFWNSYWKESFPLLNNCTWPGAIPYFPVSSGTSSGTTKYLPCTQEMIRSNTKAGMDLLVHHARNCPDTKIFGGKTFMLGGSTDLVQEASGVWSGDLSGIAVKELPWWIRPRYFPSQELALLSDWEEKIELLAQEALLTDIRMISGVPSWLLIFFDKLAELKPSKDHRLINYFPKLELLVHGGVNFAPYHEQFKTLLAGSHAELREVYPASEGFIAVGDRHYGDGLRLILDHGIFFEFVPLEELDSTTPTRHWIKNIQKDVNYCIVLSNCAGAWSYVLGDTVRFVDLSPPRVLITGRTSYSLSAFGEHLIGEEVEYAVSAATEGIGETVTDYSVGPLFPKEKGELGGHLYVIEFSKETITDAKLAQFAVTVDQKLCERNEDYQAHRANGFGLREPTIQVVPPGTFARWMKSRGKLGGQNKVPRLINKHELFENLCSFIERG